MFVRLAHERVDFLFEWQLDTNSYGTLETFGLNRVCTFVRSLHQAGTTATDDIATHLRQFGSEFLHRVISRSGRLKSCGSENGHAIILSCRATETRQLINDLPQAGDCPF